MLAGVKEANTDLFTAHLLKEQLRAMFHPPAGAGGRSVLAAWLGHGRRGRAARFRRRRRQGPPGPPEIRATLDHHMNSARAEANNTTVRMLTRRGFGYHSAEALIAITMLKRSGLCPTFPVAHPGTPARKSLKPPDPEVDHRRPTETAVEPRNPAGARKQRLLNFSGVVHGGVVPSKVSNDQVSPAPNAQVSR